MLLALGILTIAFLAAALLMIISHQVRTRPGASNAAIAAADTGTPLYIRICVGLGLIGICVYLAVFNPIDQTPQQSGAAYNGCQTGLIVPRQVAASSMIPVDLYSDCTDVLRYAKLFVNGAVQPQSAIVKYPDSPSAENDRAGRRRPSPMQSAAPPPSVAPTVSPIPSWSPDTSDGHVRWYAPSATTSAIDILLAKQAQTLVNSVTLPVASSVPSTAPNSEPTPSATSRIAACTLSLYYPSAVQRDAVYALDILSNCQGQENAIPDLQVYADGSPLPQEASLGPLQIRGKPGIRWLIRPTGSVQHIDVLGSLPTSTWMELNTSQHTPITVSSALSSASDLAGEILKFITAAAAALMGILLFFKSGKTT